MNKQVQTFLFLIFLLLNSFQLISQTILSDDIEDYDTQSPLCPQADHWTTWTGVEGGALDVPVVLPLTNSTNHAVLFEGHFTFPSGGPEDIILKLGDLTSGKYIVSFDMYIPDADGAYYNFQHFETPGIEWAFDVDIQAGGIINGTTMANLGVSGGNLTSFNVQRGKWVTWDHYIDLDNDWIRLEVDSFNVGEWQFSSQAGTIQTGTNQLGGINFYPLDGGNHFFIDNIHVQVDNIVSVESHTATSIQVYPNPSSDFIYFDFGKYNIDNQQSFDIEIYDQQGKMMKQYFSVNRQEKISIQELSSGTYFYKLVRGENIYNGKITKL